MFSPPHAEIADYTDCHTPSPCKTTPAPIFCPSSNMDSDDTHEDGRPLCAIPPAKRKADDQKRSEKPKRPRGRPRKDQQQPQPQQDAPHHAIRSNVQPQGSPRAVNPQVHLEILRGQFGDLSAMMEQCKSTMVSVMEHIAALNNGYLEMHGVMSKIQEQNEQLQQQLGAAQTQNRSLTQLARKLEDEEKKNRALASHLNAAMSVLSPSKPDPPQPPDSGDESDAVIGMLASAAQGKRRA